MQIAFHLVPQAYFDSQDTHTDYKPAEFANDGFIHLTDGIQEVAAVGNRYYGKNPEPYYYLYIDKERVRAPIRYDAEPRIYPHIYGGLNRDAIIAIRSATRQANGTFLPPEPLES